MPATSDGHGEGRPRPRSNPQIPKTIDFSEIDFDIFTDLLSFYVRTVNMLVSRDLDEQMAALEVAGGTGKISTLLLVGRNPGIRPSVLAHFILKDRSAMGRLLDQMQQAGLVEQKISPEERRARELYLTVKGRRVAEEVRTVARRQSADFFSILSGQEQADLLRLLRKVYAGYVEHAPAGD
ncbi:MAG: MarR family winged helix-turn-helix transcriptional regulator [Inquilinus sp.]|uniref:MarR family winged helix-turn-helix transcriptional regulator n=1 Tax=Inquilinus sp. TaxID=1932117 RepID=UPI003F40F5C8